ncbi:MAG: hypothetical protein FWE93_01605 [Alphaproteobacteria bacterium]|nr:hypothetical protein [Alphaproteobacteria bacterium]
MSLSEDDFPLSPEEMLALYNIPETEAYIIAKTYSGANPVTYDILNLARKVVKENNIEHFQKINSEWLFMDTEHFVELTEDVGNLIVALSESHDVKKLIEDYYMMSTDEKVVCLQKILDTAAETLDLPYTQLETFQQARTDEILTYGSVWTKKLNDGKHIIEFNIHDDALNDPIENIKTIIHELQHIKQWHLGYTADNNTLDELLALSLRWVLSSEDFGYDTYKNSPHEFIATFYAYLGKKDLEKMTAPCTSDTASTCFNEGYFSGIIDQFTDCIGEICSTIDTSALDIVGASFPVSALLLFARTQGSIIVKDKLWERRINNALAGCQQEPSAPVLKTSNPALTHNFC